MRDPQRVRRMFGRIAGRYDLLNRLLSGGVDVWWRRCAVRRMALRPASTVADVCCGTGDLTALLSRRGARVVGVDFTGPMLQRTRGKELGRGQTVFVQGDALRLPLRDDAVDAATIAFGLRNLADRRAGLAELRRVVKPGGRILVLEFSLPRGRLVGGLYRGYFRHVLPRLGGWISGDRDAYEYLPDTVQAWPEPEALRAELERAGLEDPGFQRLTGGVACLHWGRVPARGDGRP